MLLVMRSIESPAPAAELWLEVRRGDAASPEGVVLDNQSVVVHECDDADDPVGRAAARQVRKVLTRYLTEAPDPPGDELIDKVLTCANEVVTNALVHTQSLVISLTARILDHGRAIEVAVTDQDRKGQVRRHRHIGKLAAHGHGLNLLTAWASWGCQRTANGKRVWFVCPRRPRWRRPRAVPQ